jgi:hypothetical protein
MHIGLVPLNQNANSSSNFFYFLNFENFSVFKLKDNIKQKIGVILESSFENFYYFKPEKFSVLLEIPSKTIFQKGTFVNSEGRKQKTARIFNNGIIRSLENLWFRCFNYNTSMTISDIEKSNYSLQTFIPEKKVGVERTVFKRNMNFYSSNLSKGLKSNLIMRQNNFYKYNLQEKNSIVLNKSFDLYKKGSHSFDGF